MQKITLALVGLAILAASCKRNEFNIVQDVEVPVSVNEVVAMSIEQIQTVTGTILSTRQLTLNSEMTGDYYLQVNPRTGKPFAMGDRIKKGEIVVKFKNDEYENTVKLESVKLDLDISQMEYDKQNSLYEKGGVTLRELKNAEIKLINTKYSYQNALIDIAKMDVEAPFKGVITDLPYHTPGERIASNQPICEITDNNELYIEVSLPEKYYYDINRNMEVRVFNYTLESDTLLGVVTQVAPAINPDDRTFKSVVIVDNSKEIMLPGMFIKADIVLEKHNNTIVVDKSILKGRGRSQSVFIVDKGEAKEVSVTTGLEQDTKIEIVSGLKIGDRLIIRGYETLRNGSKVKVIE